VLKIAVLASTKATSMQAILDAISSKELKVEISVLISNKKEAYALERASKAGVRAVFIDSNGKDREGYDKELAGEIDKYEVDLILLIGYMRLLSGWFVDKYNDKIINIHPSLLPEFAGGIDKEVHEKVLKAGVKETGCTLHFVDEGNDTGPIIMQKNVSVVGGGETVDSLRERVQEAEQEVLVKALRLFEQGKIKIEGKWVKILE
tara:strand:+ start:9475 stop:10089 length:615 start_codon:yes stop_codon:yes gene_type:complete